MLPRASANTCRAIAISALTIATTSTLARILASRLTRKKFGLSEILLGVTYLSVATATALTLAPAQLNEGVQDDAGLPLDQDLRVSEPLVSDGERT